MGDFEAKAVIALTGQLTASPNCPGVAFEDKYIPSPSDIIVGSGRKAKLFIKMPSTIIQY